MQMHRATRAAEMRRRESKVTEHLMHLRRPLAHGYHSRDCLHRNNSTTCYDDENREAILVGSTRRAQLRGIDRQFVQRVSRGLSCAWWRPYDLHVSLNDSLFSVHLCVKQ